MRREAVSSAIAASVPRFFMLLIAIGTANPAVGAKNGGRRSSYVGGCLIQCTLNDRLSVCEKSRWSLQPVVA